MVNPVEGREQTDLSLRVERDRADAVVASHLEDLEQTTAEAVRVERREADAEVRSVRSEADHEAPRTAKEEAAVAITRKREDARIEEQRSSVDAAVEDEREERKRYLADFLALEREKTDEDLIGERVRADTLIASRDEFLGNASHDLRTLLGGLSFTAELLLKTAPEGDVGAQTRKYASAALRYVARMNRLVNDLLDIASIEAGQLAIISHDFDVASLLRDTVAAFEPIAAAKRITLVSELPDPSLRAVLDDGRILQVLANLMSNAIKFTPQGGTVRIVVGLSGGEIHFAVTDTGIGIEAEQLRTVFDRYRQVSKDRRGLGLGLHISKVIVEAHGGRMWAESELAVGSTFHFALPARPVAEREKSGAAPPM